MSKSLLLIASLLVTSRPKYIVAVVTGLTALLTAAANADLIVPNANATVNGDLVDRRTALNIASRYQEIFAASQFSHPILITGIAFRPPASKIGQPGLVNIFSELRLDLSSTAVAVGDLSSTFADNVGADNTTVFDEMRFSLLQFNTLPGPGNTAQFAPVISFKEPFFYDPRLGKNLLLDIRDFDPDFTGLIDAQSDVTGTIINSVFAIGPNSTSGDPPLKDGVVVRFSVPESGSTLTILSIAATALILVRPGWRETKSHHSLN